MSYAKLETKKIINACKEVIVDRKNWINEEREKRIAALMKPRWFFSTRNREQAIEHMKSNAPDFITSEWDEFDYYGLATYHRAKALLMLAEVADRAGQDEINVSSEDVYELGLKVYLT